MSIVMRTSPDDQHGPSAAEWLRRMSRGEISAEELVTNTADALERAQDLNAVAAYDRERAIQEARDADSRRRNGAELPLLGLPITVKDSIDVVGFPSTGGSDVRRHYTPTRDATVIKRLRDAGAVIIAKTNVPEYSSSYETDNHIFGATLHPFDRSRTPGGSSGGEGALLGAGASIVGLGVDGGGSIRVPSHYCGIVGLRPTVGRVPDTGTWPHTRSTGYRDLMCVGPLARHVEDLILILDVIAGPDWIDPYAVPAPLGDPRSVDVASLNIGYYDYDGLSKVSRATAAAVERVATSLGQCGAGVRRVVPPSLEKATELFLRGAGADGGDTTLRDLAGSEGRHVPQFQRLLNNFEASEPMRLSDFFDLQSEIFRFRACYRSFAHDFDILVSPVTPGPAPRHGEPPWGVAMENYDRYEGFNYTHALSLAGVPVAVIPAGTEDGLPVGVQISAQPYQEHVALAAALAVERLNLAAIPL